jgi:hypothetical protein
MWIIQGNKPLHNTPRYEGSPELLEQEKLLVLELEAQLINNICQIYNQDQVYRQSAASDMWQYTFR